MRKLHAIALGVAALFAASSSAALAQTVSGADPYVQGYAAGASSKERNSFDAFDSGYRAAQSQTDMQSATNSAQAFNNGYQAGVRASNLANEANRDQQQAYNEGYAARGAADREMAARAFDNGYDAGASRPTTEVLRFPD